MSTRDDHERAAKILAQARDAVLDGDADTGRRLAYTAWDLLSRITAPTAADATDPTFGKS